MRGRGDVLLVSCYELGRQPAALASPLGFLERAGFDPAALDVSVEGIDAERLAAARFVGISVPMHTALRLGVRVAARVRETNSAAHVSFFGLYATLHARTLLDGPADSVIGGEVEGPLVRLLETLERAADPRARARVAGVATRWRPDEPPSLERLAFAVPSRRRLPPLARYARLVIAGEERLAGSVEASRGCRHLCRHCPIVPVYGGRFFAVPADVVLADARSQIEAGARHLTFADPDFLNGPGHALRVARALHAAHPDLTFDVTTKIEHVLRHRRVFRELRELGCLFVVSAIESLSAEVLAKLEKGHTRRDVDEALAVLDQAGIALRPSFVPFTPWSEIDDLVELLDWIEENGMVESVDPVQLSIRLLVPGGSHLLEIPEAPGWPGPFDAASFTHRWSHRDPRVDAVHAAVAARVETGTRLQEPSALTFAALRAIALAARGGEPDPAARRPLDPQLGPRRDHPPRLSEAWFC